MKKVLKNILLFVCACCFAFILGEILTRVFLPAPLMVSIKSIHSAKKNISLTEKLKTQYLPVKIFKNTPTGTRLQPNVELVIENHIVSRRTITVKTNSLGYRNPEIGPKTDTRVLFLGDSITFADYVDEEESFVRLVDTLSRKSGQGSFETINAGIGAISLKNELAILNETGLSVDPDIVIVGFYLNDHANSPGVYIFKLPGPLAKSWFLQYVTKALTTPLRNTQIKRRQVDDYLDRMDRKAWRAQIVKNFPPGEGDYRTNKGAFNALIIKFFRDFGAVWADGAWDYLFPLFSELKKITENNDIKLGIVVFPVRYQVEAEFVHDYPQQRVKQIVAQLNIPILDVLPSLRAEYHDNQAELYYYEDQCHYTPYGNRVLAEYILDFLYEKVLVHTQQTS